AWVRPSWPAPWCPGLVGFSGVKLAPAAICMATRTRQVPSKAPRILLSSNEFIAGRSAGGGGVSPYRAAGGGARSGRGGRAHNSPFCCAVCTPYNPPMGDVLTLFPPRRAAPRLPGKPLADIAGAPMIVHVLRRAQEAAVGPVVVATDSE